jgi:hypothetical protein
MPLPTAIHGVDRNQPERLIIPALMDSLSRPI